MFIHFKRLIFGHPRPMTANQSPVG